MAHAKTVQIAPHAMPQLEPKIIHERGRGSWLQLMTQRGFEWNRIELPIPGLPAALAGLRIAHLTDIHCKVPWNPAYDELLAELAQRKPDLMLITGDFVDDRFDHAPTIPTIRRLVEQLSAPLGVFGILGNHDTISFGPRLDNTPVRLIAGQCVTVDHNGTSIELIGQPGAVREDLTDDWVQSMPPVAEGALRIFLSHFPDHYLKVKQLRPHILLAGHTHGGQICLPAGVPIIRHDSLPRRFCRGIHRMDDTWLVVGRGFGYSEIPIRAFCPNEVIELVLQRA